MSSYSGVDGKIYYEKSPNEYLVSNVDRWSLDFKTNVSNVSTFGYNWKLKKCIAKDGIGSVEGFLDLEENQSYIIYNKFLSPETKVGFKLYLKDNKYFYVPIANINDIQITDVTESLAHVKYIFDGGIIAIIDPDNHLYLVSTENDGSHDFIYTLSNNLITLQE